MDMEDDEDIEVIRQRNKKEHDELLASLLKNIKFKEVFNFHTVKSRENLNAKKNKRQRINKTDSSFRFSGTIPNERRNSARLQHKTPDYTYHDLPNESSISRKTYDCYDHLEAIVQQPLKKIRTNINKPSSPILSTDEVTEELIGKIHTQGMKKHSQFGTSCHQCRQKTLDTKTCCRSGFCFGVRGQFCGTCVMNRYGEDPVEALKDPKWTCYVCRGCCNCSICRNKMGKKPTGILVPVAHKNGFKSVQEFLTSLGRDKRDTQSEENLLGFFDNQAVMTNGTKVDPKCHLDAALFK